MRTLLRQQEYTRCLQVFRRSDNGLMRLVIVSLASDRPRPVHAVRNELTDRGLWFIGRSRLPYTFSLSLVKSVYLILPLIVLSWWFWDTKQKEHASPTIAIKAEALDYEASSLGHQRSPLKTGWLRAVDYEIYSPALPRYTPRWLYADTKRRINLVHSRPLTLPSVD